MAKPTYVTVQSQSGPGAEPSKRLPLRQYGDYCTATYQAGALCLAGSHTVSLLECPVFKNLSALLPVISCYNSFIESEALKLDIPLPTLFADANA